MTKVSGVKNKAQRVLPRHGWHTISQFGTTLL